VLVAVCFVLVIVQCFFNYPLLLLGLRRLEAVLALESNCTEEIAAENPTSSSSVQELAGVELS
jgi:hypothetical protein